MNYYFTSDATALACCHSCALLSTCASTEFHSSYPTNYKCAILLSNGTAGAPGTYSVGANIANLLPAGSEAVITNGNIGSVNFIDTTLNCPNVTLQLYGQSATVQVQSTGDQCPVTYASNNPTGFTFEAWNATQYNIGVGNQTNMLMAVQNTTSNQIITATDIEIAQNGWSRVSCTVRQESGLVSCTAFGNAVLCTYKGGISLVSSSNACIGSGRSVVTMYYSCN